MRVYLSGGMEYADDEGRNWRAGLQRWLSDELHCDVFNPNEESERFFSTHHPSLDFRALKQTDIARYTRIVRELVQKDCHEIAERSDFIICYWDEAAMRGAGTKGELTMARHFDKPVYLVTTMPPHDIPGWVLGCTTKLFASFHELKTFILSEYSQP
ncbi:MAG: hypothetical protein ACKVRP_01760 [Bacteroidota bacterium]